MSIEPVRKEAQRRYGGAIHTERSGKVELWPQAYRQILIDAFIEGHEKAVAEYFGVAIAPSPAAGQMEPVAPEQLARLFHDTYERLAPQFGYETRADTKTFDPASSNGKLMIAVCSALLSSPSSIEKAVPLSDEQIDQLWLFRKNLHDGRITPQLRDFARDIESAHGITKEPK